MAAFANKTFMVPNMGDSITEGTVFELQKAQGDFVDMDEVIAVVETDKVQVELKAEVAGVLQQIFAAEGDNIEVGKPFVEIDIDAKGTAAPAKEATKEVSKEEAPKQEVAVKKEAPKKEVAKEAPKAVVKGSRGERREPMSRMRQRIAQRLKDSQNTYALLTTFQEVDMSTVMELRKSLQDEFVKKHNVKLGFMSFFVKACVAAMQEQPILNAVIDGKEIIYRDYIDISVAVATPNGLLVPVLRNCETKGFAEIEKDLLALAAKGKANKISPDDMAGGTFTISNGGVFGSLMGTPIINPPQSAILGMHAIINRPMCIGNSIEARPMMNIVLTYDHRLIDGREAALYLKKIQALLQDPRRMLLEL